MKKMARDVDGLTSSAERATIPTLCLVNLSQSPFYLNPLDSSDGGGNPPRFWSLGVLDRHDLLPAERSR